MSDSGADSFVPLPGSEREPLPAAEQAGPVDGSQRIEVTLVTRRRAALPRDAGRGAGHGQPGAAGRAARHRPGRHRLPGHRAGPARPAGDRRRRRGPAGQGRGLAGRAERDVRRRAEPGAHPAARLGPAGRAPLPARCAAHPGRAERDRAGRAGPGRPAAGPAALPPGARSGRGRGGRDRDRGGGAGRGLGVLHAAAGGHAVQVPGRHRRDRAHAGHHRAGRRIRHQRPGHLLRRAGPARPIGHRGQRGRCGQRGPARTRTAPTARSCWTSRWPARSRRARPRWCTSRPTPTRVSWTR